MVQLLLAPYLFADLEADISTMGTSPNGMNINEGVGSTHPEGLAELVKEKGADIGLAFDGDGDRLIAVDEKETSLTVIKLCSFVRNI